VAEPIPPALVEQSEAEALYDFEFGAPSQVRAALGMESFRIGGGVVLSMRNDPTQFWSKTLGLGFEEPVTAELIEEVCGFYRAQETPMAVIQLAPSVLPEDWADICAKMNISAGSPWVKLVCDTDVAVARSEERAEPETELRVGPVEAGQAREWASVMLGVFGMPQEGLAEMVVSSVGRPDWHPYAAWDGEDLVATGTMHVHQSAAQFFSGATLPHARHRGGQSGLLTARARAADAAGCRWLVAETGAETPGTHNSSLHNMLRIGFSVLYERQNWIWQSTTTGS
jgi:hypothetical protein